MFKSCFFNTYNTQCGSFNNESNCAASSFCASLILDTVIAVSIFVILAVISSIIALAELSVIILAVLSAVIVAVAVLLAELIIINSPLGRPDVEKA